MTICTHLAGLAWMLNPEEGTAYITRFFTAAEHPPERDILYRYAFCPCCGEKLVEAKDGAHTLTMDDAHWKGE